MKSLATLIIIALLTFSAKSQSLSDSTKLADTQIRKLLEIGYEWERLSRQVEILNDRNIILYEKIFTRDSLIARQSLSIAGYENVVIGYQASEKNLIAQMTNLEKEVKKLTKKARWNNTKSFITSAALVVVGVLYLLK